MSQPPPRAADVRNALRHLQRSVLLALALCALVIVGNADPDADVGLQGADPRYTLAALGLALASILARRQAALPRTKPHTAVRLAVASLLLAAAVGLVGIALALVRDERTASLLLVLGGALLALRGPPAPARAPDGAP